MTGFFDDDLDRGFIAPAENTEAARVRQEAINAATHGSKVHIRAPAIKPGYGVGPGYATIPIIGRVT